MADKEKPERLGKFHCALGRFVAMFAKVEFGAHLVLRHYAKMDSHAARALLSGVRVDDTRDRIKRLFEVGYVDKATWDTLSPVLDHLNEINNRRNYILHHTTVGVAEEQGRVTNAAMAHVESRVVGFDVSSEILDDMTADLRKILIHFHARHVGKPDPGDPKVDAILRASWRYTLKSYGLGATPKSSPLAHTKRPVRPARPKQPPG